MKAYQNAVGKPSGGTQSKKAKITMILYGWPEREIDASVYQRLFNLGYRKGEIFFMEDEERDYILRHGIRSGPKGGPRCKQ